MSATLFLAAVTTLVPAEPVREPNPLAPSLPRLSKKEQARIQEVIDRFIKYERGQLPASEKAKAIADFNALGPEATFLLIEGFNEAARVESSCAVIMIGAKLARILYASDDTELLQFARENIGAGGNARKHAVTVKDLRLGCAIRLGTVQREALLAGFRRGEKTPKQMSIRELANAAGSERGQRLRSVLIELERRPGPEVLNTLGAAAASYESADQQLARGLLLRHLSRKSQTAVRDALKSDQPEVRAMAARVVVSRRLPYGAEVIELLNDKESVVQQAAHQALVQLSRGRDFGPAPTASEAQRADAVRQWQEWWSQQARR
jgi:hypothetical protein